jgi:tetratricopeptide (TPR) repeat protein
MTEKRKAVAHESPGASSRIDLRDKGSRVWMVLIVAGALAAGVVAVLFAFKGKESADDNARKAGAAAGDGTEPADGTMSMGEAKAVIAKDRRDQLAKQPCNRDLAYELVVDLLENYAYEDAGDIVDEFARGCREPYEALLRKGFYAHEQAGRWPRAEATATALIAIDPKEGSYWWWRGQTRMQLERKHDAGADLRQAMAATPFARSRGKSLLDFSLIADEIGATCDGAAALQAFTDANGGNVTDTVVDRQARLHLEGDCDRARGVGGFQAPTTRSDKIPVTVGTARGSFLFGDTTGYTLLSAAFAERAGVTAGTRVHEAYVLDQIIRGKDAVAAKVTFQGGSATDIHVLIVDTLPASLDGVLGQSFLYRFF